MAPRLGHREGEHWLGSFIIWFGGGALAYATILTLFVAGASLAFRRAIPWRNVPLFFIASTFVFLTQHPFPEFGSLDCPVASAAPQMQPFRFLRPVQKLLEAGAPLDRWLTNRWIMATVMNFVVCLAIGLAWAFRGGAMWTAALFGFALSLACELTQLTGIWGIYDCAYRAFNFDDLLLNTLGVLAGATLFHGVRKLQNPPLR